MFFSKRPKTECFVNRKSLDEPLHPRCYDEFHGTKIYSIIQHPKPEGDRIFLQIPYAGSAAVKARGARWDPDARRWWYWSGSTTQLTHQNNPEEWMQALLDVHKVSEFAEWDMDTQFMLHKKRAFLDLDDFFDYSNPASVARRK
jgi:hypothetical protein